MQLTQVATLIEGRLYVTPEFCKSYGIKAKTVEGGMRRFRLGQITKWENNGLRLEGAPLIAFDSVDWDSLTATPPVGQQVRDELTIIEREREESNKRSIEDIWKPFYEPLDAKYYQDKFNINGGRANGRNRAKELAICCAILRMLNKYSTKALIRQHTGYQSKAELQDAVFAYISSYGECGLYGLPSTYRNFLPKFRDFNADKGNNRDSLINGNQGNKNPEKFDHIHRRIFLEIYLDPQKGNDKLESYLIFKATLQQELNTPEKEIISYDRFKQITLEKDIQVLASRCRHGDSYYEVFVRPQVIRKPPMFSLSLVAGDGWMPGRTVIQRRNVLQLDGTMKKVVRERAMTVWFWYDWKSSAIISHYVVSSENSESIRKSFRNIIGFNEGKCPLSVMLDKKWAEQSDVKEMFETAGVMIQTKRAYNHKANIAERNMKEVNKHHRRIDPFWVDVTNHTVNFVHNDEWVRGAKPLEEEDFRNMIYEIIERHNHMPRKSLNGQTPWQVFADNINPDCKVFDPLELTYIFGATRNPRVRNYQFTIDIATRQYRYVIPADEILNYNQSNPRNDKVVVYFDELHMESVDVYSYEVLEDKSTHRFICTAIDAEIDAINAATVEEKLDERFAKQRERGEVLDNWIDEQLELHEEEMAEIGIEHAAVKQISQDRYKEAHSNSISKAYRRFHQDREEAEGHRVTTRTSQQKPWTDDEKLDALDDFIGDKWSE